MLDASDNKQRIVTTGEWRSGSTWPPVESKTVAMYVHDDDVLRGEKPASAGTHVSVEVKAAAPVPSLGGGNLTTPAGPFNQATLDARPDVYVAATEPVTAAVELVGNVRASM